MSKKYIRIENTLVEVSQEVYDEYYRMDRQERYQVERDNDKGTLYYEAFSLEDISGEEMIADVKQKSVEEEIEQKYMLILLKKAIQNLSDKEKSIILKMYYEDKPLRIIEAETEIPYSNLRRMHAEILAKLHQILE
ncbi:sigma-70 family RNA polymerase sigma factor [Lachnotalea glycerini]|uniref:Sigma-70 family RNA polymerase sigma factor n=1 Tax=Lachnotalea glycerini TaxID=1763509 RepID=A0A371JH25_9FIRM|nr:sigma-70 family RNA polymerase sigma factor [Lachnotalea glycerini]RDY32006.1 sigma-70 family RNA polymerase sigma factor [Lachnotalea glycerini]